MIRKPRALAQGDKVAIIAPSTPTDREHVDQAELGIRALSLEPVIFPTCYKHHGHLAGQDHERVKDIHDAFADPEIKGIICLKGGVGATRLLPHLDYELIKNNIKVFVGYSDITALHMAFNKICRMVTYHGPMAMAKMFSYEGDKVILDEYSTDSYKTNLFTTKAPGIVHNPPGEEMGTLVSGIAEGELTGGNLSLMISTLGSPYELDVKGKILFIEEVGEAVYRIDRMLTALALARKFADCAGIILGTWSGCKSEKKGSYNGQDLPLMTVFEEVIKPYNKPTILNFRAGHNHPQPTLAFGTQVRIDATKPQVEFLESGNI